MKQLMLVILMGAIALATSSATSFAAASKTVCVGKESGCYANLQAALDAAGDGDTIKIFPGTYAGGVTVDKSVALLGSGSAQTTISGGGPVLTIGEAGASAEPTVLIQGLTITGGHNGSVPYTDQAKGGGIWVPPNATSSGGATVTIRNSVISGNSVAPTSTLASPSGVICPGDVFCPYALAAGGGIYNNGTMTLENTVVSDNTAGSTAGVAADVEGGGIHSNLGSLTLLNSTVDNNSAVAVSPDARHVNGGGLFMDNGTLTIENSDISHNSASLTSSLQSPFDSGGDSTCPTPCHIEMAAEGGAIHVSDGIPTTIGNSTIDDNSVSVDNPLGEANPFDAAMNIGDSPFTMRNSTVRGNQVTGTVSSTDYQGAGGSAMELDGPGTIANSDISDNAASVNTPSGDAQINGGIAILPFNYQGGQPPTVLVTNSRISGNSATATARDSASALGGGFFNNGDLELRNDTVSSNSDVAHGPSGVSQGAGIWNGVFLAGPPVALTLVNTKVFGNTLAGDSGILLQGAGLFTDGSPLTLTHSQVDDNTPDQCYGC